MPDLVPDGSNGRPSYAPSRDGFLGTCSNAWVRTVGVPVNGVSGYG